MKQARLIDLGLIDYQKAWDFQTDLFNQKIQSKLHKSANDLPTDGVLHHLILCSHPNVFTIGKNGNENHLLLSKQILSEKKIDFFKSNRGGDITFHGIGQCVGYPILDLEDFKLDINWYMRSLEEVIILTLAQFGIIGERIDKVTGVWIDANNPKSARKICAFGVRTSRWITMHGFALNINTDLDFYKMIVPCGISDKGVTSIQQELGEKIDENLVKQFIIRNFETVFEISIC
ncbi:MAG: lipoyl(octanoyl) transferase LipB [Bacteroidetes bacterium]|nr:lipoyl(octanoyl) transferase LipB [Bacteroidota bacterium]